MRRGRGGEVERGGRAIPKISKWKTNFAKLEKFEVFGSRPMTRRVIISEIGLRKSSRKKKENDSSMKSACYLSAKKEFKFENFLFWRNWEIIKNCNFPDLDNKRNFFKNTKQILIF